MGITASFNSDRSNLILTVDEETQRYLQDESVSNEDFGSDNFMYDFFESFIGNNAFCWLGAEVCGDLTSAPILAILGEEQELPEHVEDGCGFVVSGMGTGHPVEERWGWMMYQIQSLQAELAEKGRAVLTN